MVGLLFGLPVTVLVIMFVAFGLWGVAAYVGIGLVMGLYDTLAHPAHKFPEWFNLLTIAVLWPFFAYVVISEALRSDRKW